jgi:hypothetical protein
MKLIREARYTDIRRPATIAKMEDEAVRRQRLALHHEELAIKHSMTANKLREQADQLAKKAQAERWAAAEQRVCSPLSTVNVDARGVIEPAQVATAVEHK